MTIDELNRLPLDGARAALERCCRASAWVERLCERRPYRGRDELLSAAEQVMAGLGREDWLEAFSHHPRIGDLASPGSRSTTSAAWAAEEQRGASATTEAIRAALAEGNRAYEEKFGYTFIVCAAGKSAEEMLAALRERLRNHPDHEIGIAAEEQMKITRLRLEKLLGGDS